MAAPNQKIFHLQTLCQIARLPEGNINGDADIYILWKILWK